MFSSVKISDFLIMISRTGETAVVFGTCWANELVSRVWLCFCDYTKRVNTAWCDSKACKGNKSLVARLQPASGELGLTCRKTEWFTN